MHICSLFLEVMQLTSLIPFMPLYSTVTTMSLKLPFCYLDDLDYLYEICVYPDIQLYHSETLELMLRRWAKLEKDFKTKNGRYDISKIPDIYDCIKYDVQHNGSLKLENTMELYRLSKALADIVIPQVRIISY